MVPSCFKPNIKVTYFLHIHKLGMALNQSLCDIQHYILVEYIVLSEFLKCTIK